MFPVSVQKNSDLVRRMHQLGIQESDLVEVFQKGSGPGGQKINKTSSQVLLKHIPSGIVVRCQETRSQGLNRFLARRILVDRLEAQVEGRRAKAVMEREKIRRQKRKRSKRAKEKMLVQKKHQSRKKQSRAAVAME